MRFFKSCAFLLSLLALTACNGDDSANDLYKFPGTKEIKVQVNIAFSVNDQIAPNIDFAGRSFLLNVFSLDANGIQAPIGYVGQDPVDDLPVTLAGAATTFDAVIRIPSDVEPGAGGYAFRFALKEQTAGLALADTPDMLAALRGSLQMQKEAKTNNVDLSLASTLADKLLRGAVSALSADPTLTAYADLLGLLQERLVTVENGIDTSVPHTVSDYVIALTAGLSNQVLTDQAFQAQLAAKLFAAVDGQAADADKAAAAQKLASDFTTTLVTLAKDLKAALGDATSAPAKVFKTGTIDTTALPDPDSFGSAVFAPAGVAFTDTDNNHTLGGQVMITAPRVQTGLASYNVYFGGDARAQSRLKLAGNVLVGTENLALTLPSGTALPDGASRFWVYPVAAGGELDLPASVAIVNLEIKPAIADQIITAKGYPVTLEVANTGGGSITSCVATEAEGLALDDAGFPQGIAVSVKAGGATCLFTVDSTRTARDYEFTLVATNSAGASTSTVTLKIPRAYLSYVTASKWAGDQLGGLSAAESKCNASDANKPSASAQYTAVLMTSGRHPAVSVADMVSIGWLVAHNALYIRGDGTVVGETDSVGRFDLDAGLVNPFATTSTPIWTGSNTNWTYGDNCASWNDPPFTVPPGLAGDAASKGGGLLSDGTSHDCSEPKSLLCVERLAVE